MTWKMYFNPTKCEFLRVINKKNIINFRYFIQSTNIQEVQQAKYLGITINNKLSWSDHIKIISNKANFIVGFILYNVKQNKTCTVFYFKTNSRVYMLLQSGHLTTTQTSSYQLEAVQRRATRYAINFYDCYQSVTKILHSLEWPTLVMQGSCQDHNDVVATKLFIILYTYSQIYTNILQCS